MRVAHIVPKLPPSISGVGDYALLLASELKRAQNIESHFIVPGEAGETLVIDGFPVTVVKPDARHLSAALRPFHSILLQYVGYGYERRGCPLWLLRGFQRWKSEAQAPRHLVTMFHELFATTGAIWNSSFWLSRTQRRITREIAKMSNNLLTNRHGNAEILSRLLDRPKRARVIPVLSTAGEPATLVKYSERKPWLVVFGTDQWAQQVFNSHRRALARICDRLRIERIIQIGSAVRHDFDSPPVDVMGIMSGDEIGRILQQSKAGFMNYASGYLAKSTIFAVYCANGVVPILPDANKSETDGLIGGRHYLLSNDLDGSFLPEKLADVSRDGREWYLAHSSHETARAVARDLRCGDDACRTNNRVCE